MAQYTILIVDYEPRSVEQLRGALEPAGYRVEVAKDGVAGAERFHELKPDLVLVEAMLPKKHGFELCSELKRTLHGQKTPIVIITGVYKGRKYRTQAMHQHGSDAYLEKPIASDQLLDTLRHLLDRHPRPAQAPAPIPAPAPAQAPHHRRGSVEDEIEGRVDAILSDEPRLPVGAGGRRGPRASVVEIERRAPRFAEPVYSRGSAQPALFSRAETEVVRGVAMPDEDVDLSESVLGATAELDRYGRHERRYPWIAFGVLAVFAATLLIILY